jgi:Protein of unknown function (DUF1554)
MVRGIGLLLASTAFALAACNALTGAADLGVCASCGDDDAALAPEIRPDAFVAAPVDASRDTTEPIDALIDGVVDAPPDAALGCNGAADCERVVFATSSQVAGSLGGINGADAKCQALADASTSTRVKGRAFQAWVSTAASSPSTRFVRGTRAYVRPDTVVIALDWNDLVSGGLRNGIALDENAMPQGGQAWTGTRSDNGQLGTSTCSDWTAATFLVKGVTGNVGGDGNGWSGSGETTCATGARLYCFEK